MKKREVKHGFNTNAMLAVLATGVLAFGVGCACHCPPPGGHARGPGGPAMQGHRPLPPAPLFQALDTNHDGVIDANEIANASASLKTLDKNGDGQLTQDELRPARPPQNRGPESGHDRPFASPPGEK